jgi:hypothetical protein
MSNEVEMSVLEQLQCEFWDMYKDAYGVRPRGIDTSTWTEADFEREFKFLASVIKAADEDRREYESGNVVKFEARVDELVRIGAKDRETALRWIMDSSDAGGDWEYFCYLNGLPYGYITHRYFAAK